MVARNERYFEMANMRAWIKPSHEAGGGDFVVRHQTPGGITVILGDATGHDHEAAEMARFMRPIITAQLRFGLSEILLRHWHQIVYRRYQNDHRFICISAMHLDLATRQLTIANAGNPDILIHREATGYVNRYPSTGMPLGIVEAFEWKPPKLQQTRMGLHDYACCISDGVVDSLGPDGKRFGMSRICAAARLGELFALDSLRNGLLRRRSPAIEQDDQSLVFVGIRRRREALSAG